MGVTPAIQWRREGEGGGHLSPGAALGLRGRRTVAWWPGGGLGTQAPPAEPK